MELEQKTFGRRNFLKGVIAGLGSLSLPLFSWAEEKEHRIHVYTTDGNNDSVYERIAQLRKYIKEFPELNPDNFSIERLETKIESFYTNPDEITIIDNLTGKIKSLVLGAKEPKKTRVYLEDGKPHEESIEPYVSIGKNIVVGSAENNNSPDVGFVLDKEFYRIQSRNGGCIVNGGYIVVDENKNDPITDFEGDFSIYRESEKVKSIFEIDNGKTRIYCFR